MSFVVKAPAKINWTLRVRGRREDGFHEIESLVSAVTLHDELTFTSRDDSRFVLTCDDPSVPTDANNLVCRAAALLSPEAADPVGLDCRLAKRIPIGGGLGGGSSDAAATLLALNRLWSLNWSVDRLTAAAARIGSDVPFFVRGGTAVISGRGEHVRPTPLGWRGWIVLILPGFPVSTAAVYQAWRPSTGERAPLPADEAGPAAVRWMAAAYNMLEEPAIGVCPALGRLMSRGRELVGRPVRISGSGSTLFTAFDSENEAREAAEALGRELQVRTTVVRPVE